MVGLVDGHVATEHVSFHTAELMLFGSLRVKIQLSFIVSLIVFSSFHVTENPQLAGMFISIDQILELVTETTECQ